jgi:hypothetical protein
MNNQDDIGCVDLLQIRGYTRKIKTEEANRKIKQN